MTFLATLLARHRIDHVASLPRLEPRIPSRFEPVPDVAEPERAVPDLVIDVVRDPEVATAPVRVHAAHPLRVDAEPLEERDSHVGTLISALTAARATVAAPLVMTPPDPLATIASVVDTSPAARTHPARTETQDEIRAVGPRPEHPRKPSLEPRPERRSAPPAAPVARVERAPAVTPTVHVSIGRVEVRAIMAPPATPPARPPSSASRPSLEDYLRGGPRGSR